jgi:tetratricopeptide (TPR) repeat protein
MTVYEYDLKGYELLIKKDWDAAVEWYTAALAEHPDDSYLIGRRCDAWVRKGEPEKALAEYTRLIDKNPPRPEGEEDEYCAATNGRSRLTRDIRRADAFNNRGHVYQEMGEYDKAIADFSEAIPLGWSNYGAYWCNRGIARYKKGDLDAALSDINKSIETWEDPECTSWPLLNRGMVWREKGDLKQALADFRKAAARNRSDGAPLYQAGYIWFLRGNPEKAIGYFSKAIERQGDVAHYWLVRGVCYWNLCVKNKTNYWGEKGETMNLAADDFGKAIECDPDMAAAWCNRGTVRCAKARDSHNLIKTIIMQKTADNAQRALLMAQLEYIGGHEHVPRFDALLRELRSTRDEAEAISASMLGLFAEDDAREAVEDLTRAVELDPGSAEAYYQRGLAFTLLGKRDLARADYEKVLALNPAHPKAAAKRDALLESRESTGRAETAPLTGRL